MSVMLHNSPDSNMKQPYTFTVCSSDASLQRTVVLLWSIWSHMSACKAPPPGLRSQWSQGRRGAQ